MSWLACAAGCVMSLGLADVVEAGDDPTGTWKWTPSGQTREHVLTLKLEGETLTGVIVRRDNLETAITDATYKAGAISFSVVRERNGQKFVTRYSGKISGDTILGAIQSQRNGQAQSRPWEAKRSLP